MKGRRHKYGFNNNKREKAEKVRVVDDEIGDKHQLDEVLRRNVLCPSLVITLRIEIIFPLNLN